MNRSAVTTAAPRCPLFKVPCPISQTNRRPRTDMTAITSLFRRFGLIASVLILTSGSDSQAQTNTVHIPDPELQSVIRATLNKPTGDITVADMESLTVLDASVNSRGAQRPA